ncbi:hypothetical protein [Streptomyces silvensis]|uniref:Uncharacterized protein n=1 Tax=Streptomyces silvensis TaxID=1765722 RepID=A0A0W7X3L3_9ACTN|nr:hypothetical protein [Streptomyces silvensis]KUF17339.1 hypothetical protein AT728_16155 [Streptomyces silvensis]
MTPPKNKAPARPSMTGGRLRKGTEPAVVKVPGLEADRFNGENIINPSLVIKGTPQEQLVQVTSLLKEAKENGEEAVADIKAVAAVNKGLLLAYAKAEDLWQHSDLATFEEWGAQVLEISPKYVHRLVRESAALAKVVALNVRCKKVHRVSRPSHAVVIAAVIDQHGDEAALKVIPKAHELAAAQNRTRPTAKLFEQAANELGYPVKLITDGSDSGPAALTAPPSVVRAQKTLGRLATSVGGVREKHIAVMSRNDADAARGQAEAAMAQVAQFIETIDKVYPKKPAVPASRSEAEAEAEQEKSEEQAVA